MILTPRARAAALDDTPRAPKAASSPSHDASAPAPTTSPSSADERRLPFELTAAPGSGVTFAFGERFSLNLRARMQLRYQLEVADDERGARELQQAASVGTARLWISGHVIRPELTFMLQLALADRDFRDGARSPIYDAYVDWRAHRDFNVRVGQFFVPFDRLRTIREWATQLADRSALVWELSLDRDVGLMLYSEHFLGDRSPVAWRVGVFGGGGLHRSATKPLGALWVSRVELRPLGELDDDVDGDLARRPRPALAIGGAVAGSVNTDRARGTTGPRFVGGTTDFVHGAVDLVFKWRGFALQAAYLHRRASVHEIVSRDPEGNVQREPTRSAHGWVAQASYVLALPVELVARLARTLPLTGTDPELAAHLARYGGELVLGANVYFNGHKLKLQADWVARMPPTFSMEAADHTLHVLLDATF
ncbi:MAG: hypothetical protein KF901_24775 [Myxococcales bacterium]|nr:hypothetical protein [Myxococcales bacterium]